MENERQMITRSQRGVAASQEEETGSRGPSGGRRDDARSVTSSRRSQRSTRSSNAARASERRVQTAREELEAQKKHNDILRAIHVAEMTLEKKQKEMKKIRQQLEKIEDCCSDEYLSLLEVCKKGEEEEEELKSQVRNLHMDETFSSLDLTAIQKYGKVVEKSASGLVDDDSDHSQQLSDDEEDVQYEDAQSKRSEESEYRQMRDRLLRLRGSTPPPVKTREDVTAPPKKEEVKAIEDAVIPNGVEQLAQVLTQALSKVTNPGAASNNSNTGEKMLARQAMKLELSPFDGNSAEWPVFLQQFKTVSTACGLTDVENLHRLQRSLKGDARSAVSALLMAPDNVPEILSVLEERFGNPRLVVQRLVEQAQALGTVKEGDHGGFLRFVDVVRNLTTTADAMKCTAFLASPQLLTQLINKLPAVMQLKWAEHQCSIQKPFPDLADVTSWLKTMSKAVMRLYDPGSSTSSAKTTISSQRTSKPLKSYAAVDTHKGKEKKCRVCDSNAHHPSKCANFSGMGVEDRWRWVRTNRYCFACLNFGHSVNECRGKKTCGIEGCDKSHHRLLHSQQRTDVQSTASPVVAEVISHVVAKGPINLNILPVTLTGPRGELKTYAMLDPGASLTVIDAQVAEQLGLQGPTIPLTHSGLHAATTVSDSRSVEVKVSGGGSGGFHLQNVRTVPQLTLPRQSVKRMTMKRWPHLKTLPISLYADARPTILIGQDHVDLCNTSELVLGPTNAPAAGRTKLGWVLMGRVGAAQESNVSYHLREETEDDLHQLVKYHFSTEAFGVKPNAEKPRSREDRRAVKIMEDTLLRVGDQWECGLLWKEDVPQLPRNSKLTALKRLYSMERKMDADPEFAEDYLGKMTVYQEKGYMRKLTMAEAMEETNTTFYLPHFLAINPKKNNKRRFVLDAASKTSGSSLNDHLLAGPDLLTSLAALLFKFREGKIAVCADVRDMFHRVGVRKEDAVAQRLLWRGMDRTKDPDVYQMDPLIFGAKCSPTIAQFVKNANAKLFASKYPETCDAVVKKYYVDDHANSHDTVSEALQRWKEMQEVMSHGNFHLCGVLSNSREFLEQIPEDLRGTTAKSVEFGDSDAMERVLGLFWKPFEDLFTFSLSYVKVKNLLSGDRLPSKRELLAVVMSIFDALGFISLFTVRGKMLLQDSWRTKIGWDDELPEPLREKWERWRNGLKNIPDFSVRRCYSDSFTSANQITLHTFVDASEQAYGAVSYFVVESSTGKEVVLVNSKARVAPLKALSIPRMELQAAVLGTRLAQFIVEEHTVSINRRVFWSDSRTVLCWLQSDGRKFQQFVSHRIGEIQELTNPDEWRWVPTKLNVADEMTRDAEECDFSPESRWVCGPPFLLEEEEMWPVETKPKIPVESDVELKREFVGVATETSPLMEVESFSSWTRLIRVTARVLQFVKKLRKEKTSLHLTPQDLSEAEMTWWRIVQQECFAEEFKCVTRAEKLPSNSKVNHLDLFVDEDGVLRLRGRLDNADVSGDTKRPVLLGTKHPYTRLLLSHHHEKGGHHGMERVVNEVRQRFFIPNLRAAVKSSWNRCQTCSNRKAQPNPPLMGQLPQQRLEVGVFPFTNTGVDYFGPMDVRIGRRPEKRWGALFTCLSTRAVHLELAASLSTDSCILAIRRFVGRRGCPRNLYSDNGTNFVGANNELQRALRDLEQGKIVASCAEKGIHWHFNPPSAPHMGGSWERLVKSVKVALHATLKERAPQEEVLQTLLVEAEHAVNSHPLTHVSIDPDDPEALTPNHFLILRSSGAVPPGVFVESDLWGKKIWRKAQRLADIFWKRWVSEYLPTLQRRTKWMKRTEPVQVGDVGVEVDPQQPRSEWKMGRVAAVFPGKDGIVRVVEWRTATGSYRRPVAKLAFFDVRGEEKPVAVVANNAAASLGVGECDRPDEE